MDIKKVLRWFLVGFFAYLLAISLLFLASAAVFSLVAAKPEKVKTILVNSDVYQKIPNILYQNIQRENQDRQTDIDLDDPAVKQAALDSFNPEFFESSAETVIDGTYAWLDGETAGPEFTVDARQAKNNFADKVIDNQAARLEKLPTCSFSQLRQIDPQSVDIFNLQCLPPGINLAQQTQRAKAELASNPDFFGDGQLSAREIENQSGQPLLSANSDLPDKFQLAKNLPLLLVLLSLISVAGIYFVSSSKNRALKRIGKTLIGVGLLTILAPIILRFVSGKLLPAVSGDQLVTDVVQPITQQFYAATAGIYYLLGGAMLLGGVLLIIVAYKYLSKSPKAVK